MEQNGRGPDRRYAPVVMTLLFLGFFAINYGHYQLSPMAAQVMQDYGMSAAAFTAAFSAPMLPGIFLALPGGLLSDKFGPRRVLITGLLVSSVGLGLRIWVHSGPGLYCAMLLLGVGFSTLYCTYAKVVSAWLPPCRTGLVGALVLSAASIGMGAGVGVTASLPSLRFAFVLSAAILSGVLLLYVLLLREAPAAPAAAGVEMRACLAAVGRCRPVLVAAVGVFLVLGACNVVGSFLPTALMQSHGLSAARAGALTSIMMAGNLCGAILPPLLVNRAGCYRLTVIGSALLYALCLFLCWQLPLGPGLWLVLFLLGLAQSGVLTLFLSTPAYLPEIGPAFGGTAGGVIATCQMLGAVVMPVLLLAVVPGESLSAVFGLCAGLMVLVALISLAFPGRPFGRGQQRVSFDKGANVQRKSIDR